jgi:hypothetical protein
VPEPSLVNVSASSVMWASTSKTEVQTNRKRGPVLAMAHSERPENPKAIGPHIVGKKRKVSGLILHCQNLQDWTDIPNWKTSRSPLMEMPLEILDKVQGIYFDLFLTDPRLHHVDLRNSKRPCGSFLPDTRLLIDSQSTLASGSFSASREL